MSIFSSVYLSMSNRIDSSIFVYFLNFTLFYKAGIGVVHILSNLFSF